MRRLSFAFFILLLAVQHSIAQVNFKFESTTKLDDGINSIYEETAPVYNSASKTLYFTRSLHPKNRGGVTGGQDIWKSIASSGSFQEATNNLDPLNNRVNNSVIGSSSQGDTLYLLSTYQNKLDLQQGFSSAYLIDDKWSEPKQLNITGLSFKSIFYSGFVSNSGKYLLISMNGKSSMGEEDLYISIKQNGKWSRPIWLGDSINSSGFEISPYLYDDGRTLVFASNGHGGFGDCDIFYAHRLDSTWTNWSKPINMGGVINSEGFDAYAYPVDDVLYYASNKGDSFSNIYTARNEGYFRVADTVRITFMMNTMKLTDVTLDVYDSKGTSVGTYLSGHSDVVKIPELHEGEDYTFTPSHDEVEIDLFSPFILNQRGEPIEIAEVTDGSMEIIPQSKEANNSKTVLPPPVFTRGMSGVFELDEIPVRNVFLALTDEEGLPTQYSSTDEQGRFEFAETPDSINLYIHTITELEYLKQNGVVSYTDSNGVKLFRAILDTVGVFVYQELSDAEIAQLLMLQDEGTESLDESTGVFKYNDLPREGVKLVLVDENDNVIEEVITDENGQFIFKKLKSESGFQIRMSEETDSELLEAGQVLFMDSEGNERNVMTSASGGAFVYKPLRPQISMGLSQMTEEDGSYLRTSHVFSIGLFKYQSLPKEGIVLRLLDENDNVVETVTTDINGQFVFSSLRADDMNYRIQVVGIDEEELDESELYFVSQDGKVVTAFNDEDPDKYTFNALNPDYFFNIKQLNERETELQITESFKDVSGQFKYQDLPKSGVKLYLLDENDKVIETVYTDEDGNFIFSKLAKESNFYVKLAEEDMALLDQSSFTLMNEENEELESEMPDDGGFSFRTLPRSLQGMSSLDEDDSPGLSRLKNLISGAFKFENLPKEGVILVLLDENDNPIETVSTDGDGHFFFSKMEEGKKYKVRVKGYNANNIDKTQLYFISQTGHVVTAYNEDGTVTYTFDKLSGDYFNQLGMLNEAQTKMNLKKAFGNIIGQYNYEGLPTSGISLGLLDEHDKLLEVTTTNQSGGFAFNDLANNSPFSVIVMDSTIDHEKVDIKLSDTDNQPINIHEQEEHTFRFKTISTETTTAAVDHMTGDGTTMQALFSGNDAALGKNDLMLNVTKFHFNSVRLSDRDRFHINSTVLQKIQKSNQPILIVGYSCDIGDAAFRESVAQQRADEVVKYLVSMGIETSRLETATISDALVGVENPTTDQRVNNRKVEIYHLSP